VSNNLVTLWDIDFVMVSTWGGGGMVAFGNLNYGIFWGGFPEIFGGYGSKT